MAAGLTHVRTSRCRGLAGVGGRLAAARGLLAGGCAFALLLGAASCGPGAASERSITFFDAHYIEWKRLNRRIADGFQEAYPDRDVRLVTSPDPRKLQMMVRAGYAPDVAFLQFEEIAAYAQADMLVPLDDLVARDDDVQLSDFFTCTVDACRFRSSLYALPNNFSPVVLFYNRDLFDAAGLAYPDESWDWDAFLDAAKALTKDTDGDGRTDQYGFARTWGDHRWPLWIWSNGGRVFAADGSACLVDRPEAIEAMTFYDALGRVHGVAPRYGQQIVGAKVQSVVYWFQTGRVAMLASTRYYERTMAESGEFSFGVAPVPRRKTRVTTLIGGGYVLFRNARNPEGGWEAMKWWAAPDAQRRIGEAGRGLPALRSAAEAMTRPATPQAVRNRVFVDAAAYARDVPRLDVDLEAIDRAERQFQRLAQEIRGVTPESACRAYTEIMNEAIRAAAQRNGTAP